MMCGVLADDITLPSGLSAASDSPKIGGTYIKNADPERLQEAMRIFRDNVPDTEYPVGTIFQVIPFEAMVKHQQGTFAKTHDWEFFALDASAVGTKVTDEAKTSSRYSTWMPPLLGSR